MWSTRAQRPKPIDSTRLVRNRGRRFVRSVAASVAARAAGPLLSLAVTPYALSKLGAERFGLFALSLAVSGWLALLDPGFAPALRVVLARRSGRLDTPGIAPLLAVTALAQYGLAAVTVAVGLVVAGAGPRLLGIPPELHPDAQQLFLLMSVGAAVSVVGRRYSAALDACQSTSADRAVRLAQGTVRALLLAALLALGMGVEAAGWSYLIACVAGVFGLSAVSRKLLPELRWRSAAATRDAFRELFRPGLWLSLGAAAGVLITGVDRAVVARFVSLEAVTVFALSAAAFLLAETMLTSAVDAARPTLAQALGAERKPEAVQLYVRLVQSVGAAAPLAALSIFAANRAFVGAWAGTASYGGWQLDAFFGLALIVNLLSLPHRAFLSASLRVRRPTLLRLAEGVLNLAVSAALAVRFGVVGAAAGTVVAAALTSLWALPMLAAPVAGVHLQELLSTSLRGIGSVGFLLPLAFAVRSWAGPTGYLAAACAGLTVAVAGAALWWTVGLSREARRQVRSFVLERRATWQGAA